MLGAWYGESKRSGEEVTKKVGQIVTTSRRMAGDGRAVDKQDATQRLPGTAARFVRRRELAIAKSKREMGVASCRITA